MEQNLDNEVTAENNPMRVSEFSMYDKLVSSFHNKT